MLGRILMFLSLLFLLAMPGFAQGTFPQVIALSGNTVLGAAHINRIIECTAGAGGITLTLPAAATNNPSIVFVKKIDAAAGSCVIARAGSDTIDGATSYVLSGQYKWVWLASNGSAWDIIDSSGITNTVLFADMFPGADCAAKVNSAEAALGTTPGEIWVSQDCGLVSTTALTISHDNHLIRFIQGGTYTFSSLITLSGNNSTIYCSVRGDDNHAGTTLKEAAGANLATFIAASGYGVRIENCGIDGNKANNAGALDGVVASAAKFQLYNSTIHDFKRDNLVLGAGTQGTNIANSTIFNAGRTGEQIDAGATDLVQVGTTVVNNATYQVHSGPGSVGGLHFIGGDYSGLTSGSHCIFLDGTGASVNNPQIVGVNINPCGGHSIYLINATQFVISGVYITNPGQSANNTYDGILIHNYGAGVISGYTISDGSTTCSGHSCMRYGINIDSESQPNSIGSGYISGHQTLPYRIQPMDAIVLAGIATGIAPNAGPLDSRIRTTAQFDKTNDVVLQDITGLTRNVLSGLTYYFEAILFTTSNVAGGVQAAIAGTATATAIIYEGLTVNAGLTTQGRAVALGGAVGGVTAVTAAQIRISGTITVNAGGTLTAQFAQNAANGAASSILVGSTFTVKNVP